MTECPTCTPHRVNGTCAACARLMGLTQCNHCLREHPNAQTLKRRAITATMQASPGMTAAQAEALHGVSAGPVVG